MSSRGSHQWCVRCHERWVDKRSAYSMCPPCKQAHRAELRVSRHKVKARRAARASIAAQGVAMPTDNPPVPPTVLPEQRNGTTDARASYHRRQAEALPEDIRLEIGGHYEDRRIPADAIARAYTIANQTLSIIVDDLGLTRRGPGGGQRHIEAGHFEADGRDGHQRWVSDVAEELPEPQVKALEQMLKLPTPPEPPLQHSVVENLTPVVPDRALRFEARVEGTLIIRAADMLEALQRLQRSNPDLKVTAIREA